MQENGGNCIEVHFTGKYCVPDDLPKLQQLLSCLGYESEPVSEVGKAPGMPAKGGAGAPAVAFGATAVAHGPGKPPGR